MTPDGFGAWPGADDHATVGGPVRPVATDGGAEDDEGPSVTDDVDDLPRALRRRIETALAAEETLEAFLASAWERHRDAPAVETIVDAARAECDRRDLEVDALTLTPEVELPRAAWERIWYRYLDRIDRKGRDAVAVGDTIHEFVEFAPTLVVPDDPDTPERDELVVRLDEWPVVPRRRDGEPLGDAPDADEEGEEP